MLHCAIATQPVEKSHDASEVKQIYHASLSLRFHLVHVKRYGTSVCPTQRISFSNLKSMLQALCFHVAAPSLSSPILLGAVVPTAPPYLAAPSLRGVAQVFAVLQSSLHFL